MIVVDTSAITAIAFNEPERDAFVQAIQWAGKALISTVSVVEARIVIHGRRGQRAVVLIDDSLRLPVLRVDRARPCRGGRRLRRFRRLRSRKRPSRKIELWRPVRLRARQDARPAAALQWRRFRRY